MYLRRCQLGEFGCWLAGRDELVLRLLVRKRLINLVIDREYDRYKRETYHDESRMRESAAMGDEVLSLKIYCRPKKL
jgi:hypothetical protein